MRSHALLLTTFPAVTEARLARAHDRDVVVRTLTKAFVADPTVRWLFPDEASYPNHASAFFGALFDLRLEGGEIWIVAEGASAALWNPPGGNRLGPAEVGRRWYRFLETLEPPVRQRLDTYDRALASVLPTEASWYLGVLGTHPDWKGRGLGRTVLIPVLRRADRARVPATLETSHEPNLSFYARLGFEVVNHINVPDGPHVRALTRPPSAFTPVVTDLAGVILWTAGDRFAAMSSFYRDLLQLPLRKESDDHISFQWGGQRLTVAVHDLVVGGARDPLRVMVNLAVEGVHDLATRLSEAGIRFLRPPERESWGGTVATFSDPDGNTIQLLEFPGR